MPTLTSSTGSAEGTVSGATLDQDARDRLRALGYMVDSSVDEGGGIDPTDPASAAASGGLDDDRVADFLGFSGTPQQDSVVKRFAGHLLG